MMGATFNGNPCTTIISCYSPTNNSEEMEITNLYNELSSLSDIHKHNLLIISRNMNDHFRKKKMNSIYTTCKIDMANI